MNRAVSTHAFLAPPVTQRQEVRLQEWPMASGCLQGHPRVLLLRWCPQAGGDGRRGGGCGETGISNSHSFSLSTSPPATDHSQRLADTDVCHMQHYP